MGEWKNLLDALFTLCFLAAFVNLIIHPGVLSLIVTLVLGLISYYFLWGHNKRAK